MTVKTITVKNLFSTVIVLQSFRHLFLLQIQYFSPMLYNHIPYLLITKLRDSRDTGRQGSDPDNIIRCC